jgi:hypothetical protein
VPYASMASIPIEYCTTCKVQGSSPPQPCVLGFGLCKPCFRAKEKGTQLEGQRKRTLSERGGHYAGFPKAVMKVYLQAKQQAGGKEECSHPPVVLAGKKKSVPSAVSLPPVSRKKQAVRPVSPALYQQQPHATPAAGAATSPQPAVESASSLTVPISPAAALLKNAAAALGSVDASSGAASRAAASPVTPIAAPFRPQSLFSTPDTGKRVVSKRFKEGSTTDHLTWKDVFALVKALMTKLPKNMQISKLKDKSIVELDQILDDQEHLVSTASVAAQIAAARQKMTQQIQRDVCIRILALLATDAALLQQYRLSIGGTDHLQLDAGKDPAENTGQGMGLNHRYHQDLCAAFNNTACVPDFPFEYHQNSNGRHLASDAVTEVPCPPKIRGGFFTGMGLKQPRIPEGFPFGFFDVARLNTIFQTGKAEYHSMMSRRVELSGAHGGRALWWFVAPVKTCIPEEQVMWLDLPAKRWDSLAFHMMFEEVEDLKLAFAKTIPGGKGGAPIKDEVSLPPGSSQRATLARSRDVASNLASEQLLMKRELHDLQVAQLRRAAAADSATSSSALLQRILETSKLRYEFDIGGHRDMVQHCDSELKAMKASLSHSHCAASSEPSVQ